MKNDIPAGYLENARGDLVPESKVSELDKLKTQVVTDLCEMAQAQSQGLREFKLKAFSDMAALATLCLEKYGVQVGGEKGNATFSSFDGRYQVKRQMQDHIVFGVEITAAKALIDECVREWSRGASDNIAALVAHAFQTDKQGQINVGRVLSLRQLVIDDPKWKRAMDALADSMHTQGTKAYVRFFKRNDTTGAMEPIVLDVAAV